VKQFKRIFLSVTMITILLASMWAANLNHVQAAPKPTSTPLPTATTTSGGAQKMAIPSYFYPGAYWTQLENAAPVVGLAIINPNSGPGTAFDQNYYDETRRAQAKGILLLGYVHTSYGARAASVVKAEIDQFYSWYGVSGIFFDEASNDCAFQGYYLDLYNYVKAKGGAAEVVINPGTNTPECYVTTADIILNFESTYRAYQTWAPSGWEFNYPAGRFWHLVIGASSANMPNAIALSKQRHAGWVYVTNDKLPNPWDTLPADPYWTNELSLINQ